MNDRVRDAWRRGLDLARAGAAAATWPRFSLTSYAMVTALVRQGVRPHLVVDVGANQGQFTTAVLELISGSRVVAFEPIPDGAAALRSIGERFPGRLEVVEAAVGAEAGRAELTVNAHSQSSSLLELTDTHLSAFPGATPEGRVSVDVVRLDAALAGRPLGMGSLLKVDVQGFEREALTGAGELLGQFEHVVIEASFRPLYDGEWTFTDLLDFAAEHGLRFLRPVGDLRDPRTGEYLQIDALFSGTGHG